MARAKKPPVEEVEEVKEVVEEVVETEAEEVVETAAPESGEEVPAKKTYRVRVTHGGHQHEGKVYGKSDGPFTTDVDLPAKWPEKFAYA